MNANAPRGHDWQRQRRAGFTLLELLVSLLLTAVFAVAAHRFCLALLQSAAVLEATSRLEEGARVALLIIARDLRDGGYGMPEGAPPLRAASADAVSLARDLDGDGDSDDTNERVGYRFDAASGQLLRQLGDAPPQPMLQELAANGLALAYYDAAGDRLPASLPLTDVQLAEVRRVDLSLILEIPHPVDRGTQTIRVSRAITVTLRNG